MVSRVELLPFLSLLNRLPRTWHPRPIYLVPGSLGEADLLSEIATLANLGRRGNICGNHRPPEVGDGGLAEERTNGQVEMSYLSVTLKGYLRQCARPVLAVT